MIEYMLKTTINHKKLVKETYFFFAEVPKKQFHEKLQNEEEPVAKIPKVEKEEFENVGANLDFLFKDQQEEKNESFWRQTNSREKVSEQKRQQKILKVRKEKLWFFFHGF